MLTTVRCGICQTLQTDINKKRWRIVFSLLFKDFSRSVIKATHVLSGAQNILTAAISENNVGQCQKRPFSRELSTKTQRSYLTSISVQKRSRYGSGETFNSLCCVFVLSFTLRISFKSEFWFIICVFS